MDIQHERFRKLREATARAPIPLETMEEILRAHHALPPVHLRPESKVARFKAVQEALNKVGPGARAAISAELRDLTLKRLADKGDA